MRSLGAHSNRHIIAMYETVLFSFSLDKFFSSLDYLLAWFVKYYMQLTIRIIIINTRTNDTYVSFATFFAFFSRAHFHYVSRYFQSLKTKNYFVFCFSSVNLNVNNVKSVCARNFFFLFCLFSFVF